MGGPEQLRSLDRQDQTNIGILEIGHKLRGHKGEHQIAAHGTHDVADDVDQLLVVPDGTGADAVTQAGEEEQQGDDYDDGGHEGRITQNLSVLLITQQGVFRQHQQQHCHGGKDQGDQRPPQAPVLSGGQGVHRGGFVPGILPQPWFRHLLGNNGTDDGDEKGGAKHKVVVGHRGNIIAGIQNPRAHSAEAAQQRVNGTQQQIGAEASRHTEKGGGDARHGMALEAQEDHGSQGHHHHIAGVGSHVGHNADEHHHGRHHPGRGVGQQLAEAGAQQSGAVSGGDAQHGHQHHPHGSKAGEVGHRLFKHKADTVRVQQAAGHHMIFGDSLGSLIHLLQYHAGSGGAHQGRGHHHHSGKDDEQRHRMGQLVAGPFNKIQHPVQHRRFFCGLLFLFHSHCIPSTFASAFNGCEPQRPCRTIEPCGRVP